MASNGTAIRVIRRALGWQARKLAKAAGISAPYLCNIEAGRRQASPEVLRRLAAALGVPMAALTGSLQDRDAA